MPWPPGRGSLSLEKAPLRAQRKATRVPAQLRLRVWGSKGTRTRPLVARSCKGMWGTPQANPELGGGRGRGGAEEGTPISPGLWAGAPHYWQRVSQMPLF